MSCSQIESFWLTKVNSPPWAGGSASAGAARSAAAGAAEARLPLATATSGARAAGGSARDEAGGTSGFFSGRFGSIPKTALQFQTEAGKSSAAARQTQKSGQNQTAAAKPSTNKARTAKSRLTGCRASGFNWAST